MLRILSSVMILNLLILMGNFAQASDAKVDAMGKQFVSALPSEWRVTPGSWEYLDVVNCFVNGPSCFGNNPTSPYGSPTFYNEGTQTYDSNFKMNPSEAVVIFLRTPSEMRYFGFSQYLFTRGSNPKPIFASLSDTLNLKKFTTLASIKPGDQVFDQYAVVVWTADSNTLTFIQNKLALQGIPKSKVNFIPLPYNLPVHMGYSSDADSFNMLMRTALPTVPENFKAYMEEKPFYVVRVGPANGAVVIPAPTIGYANEISGFTEASSDQTALNNLVSDIKKKYFRNYVLRDQNVNYSTRVGWDCINTNQQCAGDNHDALYSLDVPTAITFQNVSDIVIVAGVNHQKTGKALYLNHSVYDTVKLAGIAAVADPELTTLSALYHAGVTSKLDPRIKEYKNLYAYVVSYDCAGIDYCLAIPAPTAANPVGLQPKAPFYLVGRSYVEPHTNVRPDPSEIVHHQVMIGTKK